MESRLAKVALVTALMGLTGTTVGASAAERASEAQACVPKRNLEAIVDDSTSMSTSDPSYLRVRALELFLDTPGNEQTTLGAIEFSGSATRLFAPTLVGPSRDLMKSIVNQAIQSDGSYTDYNDAFGLATAENPTASGRIFLTDGDHTDPTPYYDGHRGGPPVYVLGLGAAPGSTYEQVLQRIAAETGGLYRSVQNAFDLQPAMVTLNAAVNCLAAPVTYEDTFAKQGQVKTRALPIRRKARTVNVVLSWADPNNTFDVGQFRIVRKGKTIARSAKAKRLKITRRRGSTFVTVRVSGLQRGKLRFKLRARRLAFSGSHTLTTQASVGLKR